MIDKKYVEKLANLSRIEISEEEKGIFIKDLDAILGYVSEVQKVIADDIKPEVGRLRNVMREDGNPHESCKFTKDILKEAPNTKDGYIKVKKIL
jgi:aspartyl-tRNA(Asn)/glutamyl-tRNA(Gln) amidotransferase subunit C